MFASKVSWVVLLALVRSVRALRYMVESLSCLKNLLMNFRSMASY